MTSNVFIVRNVFYPYKNYSSFLGCKLTMFKLCNYGIVMAKISRVIFGLFWLILLLVNFYRTIRDAYVYFVVYDLFSSL
jgi:hypothetical protein